MSSKTQIVHQNLLNKKIKDYSLCEVLGSGTSSTVYHAFNFITGQQVAIKVIPKQYVEQDKKYMELVKSEIDILKSCKNQNVIRCYEVFRSSSSIFIVMQYCEGPTMEDYLHKKRYLSQDHAVWFLKQILNGFKGLHEIGVIHRDFKLANILLDHKTCKIADMGYAKQIQEQQLTETILGTYITMAPEVLQEKPYGIKADIWSLGVVFYQMLTGKYPYDGKSGKDLLKNIKVTKDFSRLRISSEAKNFIEGCLTYDSKQRINWVDIYNHPILNKQSIQLIYGISKVNKKFSENQLYYRKTYGQNLNPEQIILLRNSQRKDVIIDFIKQVNFETINLKQILDRSKKDKFLTDLMMSLGVQYGTYLNQLSCPMKFVSLQLIQKIPKINHYPLIYLIYKKVFNQIRDFHFIVQNKINIFKIEGSWNHFIGSSTYEDISNIVLQVKKKSELIYSKVEKILLKNDQLLENDEKFKKEIAMSGINRQEFSELVNFYKLKYTKEILAALIQSQKIANWPLIDLSYALLYYLDQKAQIFFTVDKTGGKKKLAPERYDWNSSRIIDYEQSRIDSIKSLRLIITP